jgi:3-isopropylmalate dehydratase small subunit
MGNTIVEKIIADHSGRRVRPGDIVDLAIDVRLARDFGGANVVRNIETYGLDIDDPRKTFFTFDCNPCGSDQKYATNQQICRDFARTQGIGVFDINRGIGTHIAIEEGLIAPGGTLVSTDSHANIMGAIGAFGQGMGDQDIAHAFAFGKIWFRVPPTLRVILTGIPGATAGPKDVALAIVREVGSHGFLGYSVEYDGPYTENLALSGRITIASMATEMGGTITFFPPGSSVMEYYRHIRGNGFTPVFADADADYEKTLEIDIDGLEPLIALPGSPENVVEVTSIRGRKIDSAFIGSCTNGRFEDMLEAAKILRNREVAPGVVLKIVPATDRIWGKSLSHKLIDAFKLAGALVGNAGCAGCAAGQIGQNGPGEVTVSTGNRNFPGKQGKGEVYLCSPGVAAASAVAGIITTPDSIPQKPVLFTAGTSATGKVQPKDRVREREKPTGITGRVWVIPVDNIDTDMIYHNSHLTVTDPAEMGRYAFGNLKGWENFSSIVSPGDVIITGENFGCGSSRQQAVDCFIRLGIAAILAPSFGTIYERNAINAGLPILTCDLRQGEIKNGDTVTVDFSTGKIEHHESGRKTECRGFSAVQMDIYRHGGLLRR